MTTALEGLEPELVWDRFAELTRIARPPREEAAAREHVLAWARAHAFETAVDDAGNVVVRVPPSDARESTPTVVLQSHLDMVCERDPDSPFDPRAGRIHVVREDDWVLAEGTTLGADNGIGVAAAMAVAEDPAVEHGPLELLFTVCEEEGLEGAKALAPELVSGRLLVNLDGTSETAITIGCAGSAHTFVRVDLVPDRPDRELVFLRVAVSGARGGHSGGDIASGRANAIEALGRVLRDAYADAAFALVHIAGGVSRNAIPRDAEAVVALRAADVASFRDTAGRSFAAILARHAATDPELSLAVDGTGDAGAADDASTRRVLDLLAVLPIGVVTMSEASPGTVETSTSLNVVRTEDGVVTLASMSRSSRGSGLDEIVQTIEAAAHTYGAEVEVRRSYPPWEPDVESPLLTTARSTYERLFGAAPGLEVVHGGLECAVLGSKLPGVEMISLGPRVEGPHAPGERLGISSTQRFYRLLGALLDDLSS
jgi:dipeptidase D